MAGYRIISADSHVFEPRDLWATRMEPKFRDRAPHILHQDGADFWVCDDVRVLTMAGGMQPGARFEGNENLSISGTFEQVRLGGYIPEEHLKDMDTDGVDVSIVYPTAGLLLYSIPDGELLSAVFRACNDWVAEFCSASPKRLKGIATLSVDDVAGGVRELERCANMGLVGALITVFPFEDKRYLLPDYEPLWAAAQDLQMPLALHTATNRPGPGQEFGVSGRTFGFITPGFNSNLDHWVRVSLADMIFSGVFERHPKLQVGSVEFELSWVPYFLERIDYSYTQRARQPGAYRFQEDMLPSDYFHRNVFLGFQEDALGIRLRDIIGVDHIQWGSDYPHMESTFPRSQRILAEILADCTEEEKAKIAGGNAARVYRLD